MSRIEGMWDSVFDLGLAAGLIVLFFGLAIFFYALGALIGLAISLIVAYIRYQAYLAEELERFDEIVSQVGADGNADSVIGSVFGITDFSSGGYVTTTDWTAATLFGVEVDRTL